MPPDKASGSDGFSARFYHATWSIIRPNITQALDAFWRHDKRNLHDVNETLMVLLPKTENWLEGVNMQ
jgi:hypothetical protein